MEWSKLKNGLLLTGSEDTTVQLWDVNGVLGAKKADPGTQIKPLTTFKGHTKVVEDVDWHPKDDQMFGSVGDDRVVRIWDCRASEKAHKSIKDAHDGDINGIAFNPVKEYLVATSSADKTVKLWDLRNADKYVTVYLFRLRLIKSNRLSLLRRALQTFSGHSDQVYKIEWAPFNESILASCSDDRRIAIWDMSRYVLCDLP